MLYIFRVYTVVFISLILLSYFITGKIDPGGPDPHAPNKSSDQSNNTSGDSNFTIPSNFVEESPTLPPIEQLETNDKTDGAKSAAFATTRCHGFSLVAFHHNHAPLVLTLILWTLTYLLYS